MSTIIVATDLAGTVKPSFATSPTTGLTVRANGEDGTKVLDANGNIFDALISYSNADDHMAIFTDLAPAGFPIGKWAAYTYVYAATTAYPFVENAVAIGGSVAPRSNPNRQTPHQVGAGGEGVKVEVPYNSRVDIDQIWVFRTEFFDTELEASNQAIAGRAFFIGSMANIPAQAGITLAFWDDLNPAAGTDQIEVDNGEAPVFRFVLYRDPYWWGWGNLPWRAQISWELDGTLTITESGKKWYGGRTGQYIRLEGITTGGIDGKGTFTFRWVTETTGMVTLGDYSVPGTIDSAGAGTAVIQGPSATLYRSKPRNPFSWGHTTLFDTFRVPETYAFKVGGGLGTAIAVIPNTPLLLLSTEFPAGSFTLDLRQAGTDSFERTLRSISDFYSVSAHFSQFPATRPDSRVVLWGWDAKNYAILECDGFSIYPISQQVSKTLRAMTTDRSRQQLAHGAYDARNRLNCLWLPTSNSGMLVNFLICQHAPTGQWFMHDEHDVLCSSQFQDGDTNLNKIYIGTQSGFVGEAFAEGYYWNWLKSTTLPKGLVTGATGNTINCNVAISATDEGYIGNWCLVTDANGEHEQWARISAASSLLNRLTFDFVYSEVGGGTSAFNPVPAAGWRFYIGLIEVRATKYFDLSAPSSDKKLTEIWLTLDGVDIVGKIIGDGSTFLRYYRDRSGQPYAPLVNGLLGIPLKLVHHEDTPNSQAWFTQEPPTDRIKTFGIEIIDRAYLAWKLYNWTLKVQ